MDVRQPMHELQVQICWDAGLNCACEADELLRHMETSKSQEGCLELLVLTVLQSESHLCYLFVPVLGQVDDALLALRVGRRLRRPFHALGCLLIMVFSDLGQSGNAVIARHGLIELAPIEALALASAKVLDKSPLVEAPSASQVVHEIEHKARHLVGEGHLVELIEVHVRVDLLLGILHVEVQVVVPLLLVCLLGCCRLVLLYLGSTLLRGVEVQGWILWQETPRERVLSLSRFLALSVL